jgi:hypothetical protein
MTRYRQQHEIEEGWTEWVHPLPGYKMACCDCGLVHNLEFRIDAIGQINFRAKRNARSTAQMRRHRKEKEPAE